MNSTMLKKNFLGNLFYS